MKYRYVIITEKKASEKWWNKIPIRDFSVAVLAAGLTYFITIKANHTNNNEQFKKEWRDRREIFVDDYFKDLNSRFSLCLNLVDEESIEKKNHQLIKDDTKKIEEERFKMINNASFDSLQFSRFSLGPFYQRLNLLNKDLNIFFQVAEGANDDGDNEIKSIRTQETNYLLRIREVERQVFNNIDAKIGTND
jgi:hypothetical protein